MVGSVTINSFTVWQKKGPGGHEDMSWEKSNFILTKSVSPTNTPSSQPLSKKMMEKKKTPSSGLHGFVTRPVFFYFMQNGRLQISVEEKKTHQKVFCVTPYICSQKHTWVGGRAGGAGGRS